MIYLYLRDVVGRWHDLLREVQDKVLKRNIFGCDFFRSEIGD